MSEVKAVAEEQFGELLAAVRKAQADVMLFLEEKEQAALGQASGIKTHLECRGAEMERTRQELDRIAAISSPVLFLEVRAAPGRASLCSGSSAVGRGPPLINGAQGAVGAERQSTGGRTSQTGHQGRGR